MVATLFRLFSAPMSLLSALPPARGRRALLLLAAAGLLFAARPAAGQIGVQVRDVSGDVGEAISIPIEVDSLNGREVTAYEFALPFDPSVVEVTGVNVNGTVTPSSPTVNVLADTIKVSFSSAEPLSGSGLLLTLNAQLTGSGSDRLDVQSVQFFDQDGVEVPSETDAGIVTDAPLVDVQVPDVQGRTGDEVSLALQVDSLNGRGVTAYEFALPFDSSVVDITGVDVTDTVTPTAPTVNVEGDTIKVSFSSADPLSGDGPLLRLQAVLTGIGTDRLDFDSFHVFDQNGNEVASAARAGLVRSAPRITGRIPDTSGQAGETLSIPVRMDSLAGADVTAYDVVLPFDASVVEVTGVDVSNAVTPSAPTVNIENGELRVSFSGTEALSGDGPLLTIEAQLVGAGSEVLDFQSIELFNSDAEQVGSSFASGIVTVEGSTAGIEVRVPKQAGDAGQAITIPIQTDSLDGEGVTAYQFTLPFDPSVLDVTGVDVAGTNTPSRPTTNVGEDEVKVSFSAADPLSGDGALLNLRAQLVGGGETVLDFSNVQFFDETATAVPSTAFPGRITARTPSTASSAEVQGDGTVTFEGTGTSIRFSDVSGSGRVTVRKFSEPPTDTSGIAASNVSESRYVISTRGDLSFGSETEARFDTSSLAGLSTPSVATVYQRDSVGTGQFSSLSTRFDSDAGELVATVPSFSEFAIASNTTSPAITVGPSALSDTLGLGDTASQSIQISNTASGDAPSNLTFEVQVAPQQSEPVDWLTATPATGNVAPGESQAVTVEATAGSIPPGSYETTLRITSNDPEQTETDVPVSLTVERPPLSLTNPGELPAPGTGTSVELNLPGPITPLSATFFYRQAGARSFQDTTRNLSDAEAGGTTSFSIPGHAVTKAGVRYYARLRGLLPNKRDTLQLTVPSTAPGRTAFLPATRGQVKAQGAFAPETYRMVSVPAALGDRSVFEVLRNQYGAYDPTVWRLARWSPSDSTYRLGSNIGSLQPGEAAWLITARGDSLAIDNAQSTDASGARSISLGSGWNQIGTPFPFPIAWNDIQRPKSVRAPFGYDSTGYQSDVSVLAPWRGYYVYNRADTAVTLQVPPVRASLEETQSTSLAKSTGANGYRLHAITTLHREDRYLQDRTTWLGFAAEAEPGFGPKDRAKPPGVGPHVRLHVAPEEGPALARSLKPHTQEGAAWNLRVGLHLSDPLRSPQKATIVLDEEGARPSGFQRYVVDRDRGRRLPITNQSVTVRLTPDRPTRRLRVIVGTEAFARTKSEGASLAIEDTKLRANAPNPFTESTTIPYQLAEREAVTIAIYDLLGRRVKTLVDATRKAGVHEVEWTPGQSNRRPLSSGVYFCRMKAGSYAATRKLVLVR